MADGHGVAGEQGDSVPELTDEVLDHSVVKQLGGILYHEVKSISALADHDADIAAHFLERSIQLNAQPVFL